MPIELSYLSASVALLFVMLLAEAVTGNLQYSTKDLLGARDDIADPNAAVARCKRATQNMLESLAMFAPLVIIAVIANRANDMTALGSAIFFWSRVAYAPSYWFGVPVVRTLVWFGGIVGIVLIFLQVLPFSGAA
ncbi:MAG: MAPEG family protein [Pseudomonadota bacterium]